MHHMVNAAATFVVKINHKIETTISMEIKYLIAFIIFPIWIVEIESAYIEIRTQDPSLTRRVLWPTELYRHIWVLPLATHKVIQFSEV